MTKKLWNSFDKIRLVQQVSRIESRSQCDTSVGIGPLVFDVPLVGAAMHSLVNQTMIKGLEGAGSGVVQPRGYEYYSTKPMRNSGMELADHTAKNIYEDGNKGILFVEVANGLMTKYIKLIEQLRRDYPELYIAAGTVMNYHGCKVLYEAGASGVLINIGNGSACLTTPYTGVGLPIAASLQEMFIYNSFNLPVDVIISGGIKTIGEFVKCIALGADLVMSGSLFKKCYDTRLFETEEYYGEASSRHKGNSHRVEGKHESIKRSDLTERTVDVIKLAKDSLQSAMSYSDSFNILEFRYKASFDELE